MIAHEPPHLQPYFHIGDITPEQLDRAIRPVCFSELRQKHPQRRPELIEGLLRVSETWNLIAAAKVGKSWLSYGLAVSVATGGWWLDRFKCKRGRVLIIDNELHPDELSYRLGLVADALKVDDEDLQGRIDVITLRGRLLNINQFGAWILDHINPGHYSLIVLDAKYRAVAGGENDNDDQRDFYNLVDRYAEQTGAAWVLVHHSSKGDQSGKAVTDVGAGGGSQSRAADVHMILRDHEEEDCAVLEAAVRSNAPVEPTVVRFAWPLWCRQEHLDPRDIKTPRGKREASQEKNDRETTDEIRRILKDADGPLSLSGIVKKSKFGRDRITRGLALLAEADELDETTEEHANGKPFTAFTLAKWGSTADIKTFSSTTCQ